MPEFDTYFPLTYLPSQGFKLDGYNTDCIGDSNSRSAVQLKLVQDGNITNPGFTTTNILSISLMSPQTGHNNYGGVGETFTQGKHTWCAMAVDAWHTGAGQRILSFYSQTVLGMGDSGVIGLRNTYYGGPIAGDEGQGFGLVSHLDQGHDIQKAYVTGPSPVIRSALNTTTTQVIAQNKDVQTVTVASSAGAAVGDWVIVEQQIPSGYVILEAVQITAVNSGGANRISGKFVNNHPSGVTVKPATCILLDGAANFGQDRVLVNLSGASYSTGQIGSAGVDTTVGVGTLVNDGSGGASWSNGMVGGSVDNIGAIAVTTDTYTGAPFSPADPLRSWHQITHVKSATEVGFHTFSTSGDTSYKGRGVFPSAYIIRPAARMLRYDGGRAICEYSTHTWSIGDVIECVTCPYPTVLGFQYHMSQWTPNGQYNAVFMDILNTGARTIQTGFHLHGQMQTGSNADLVAFGTGITMSECDTGISIINVAAAGMTCALRMQCQWANGATDDNGSKIDFGAGFMMIDSSHKGLYIHTTTGGGGADPNDAQLRFIGGTDTPTNPDLQQRTRMDYTGSFRLHGWMDIEEVAAAPTATANIARLYCVDDGAGKTRLMALFQSGAAVQLAIEPSATSTRFKAPSRRMPRPVP